MARLATLRKGDWDQFDRLLNGSDLTAEEVQNLIAHPDALDDMLKAMRKHAAFRNDLVHGVFNRAETLLAAFQARCKEKGIDFDKFRFVGTEAPLAFTDDPEVAVVLDATLATLQETFEFAWEWTKDGQQDSWRWDGFDKTDPDHLRLLEGSDAFEPFTLRWRRVKLDANVGKKPIDIRDPKRSPGIALMFAAAQHPERIRATDYKKRFAFCIPGLQCTAPGRDPWRHVPSVIFLRDDRRVLLDAGWDDYAGDSCAVPVLQE